MSGGKSPLVMPSDFKGTPREIVTGYLKDTVFENLFDLEIPFEIPTSRYLEHAVLVAGSGHGKTQTLGALIARFLQEDDPPALVVVDSTGALVKKIETLALFNDRLKDRIVIIDPEHEQPPALNMFDVSNARMRGYSESMRASVETEIVQLFNYIFTSAQNDLTSRQGTVFSYVVRLVLSMPGSTIDTLRQVLEEDPKGGYANSKYRAAIEALDATAQDFFKNQYFELKGFREQIAQRVYGLVQVPAFQRMFASNNKVDFLRRATEPRLHHRREHERERLEAGREHAVRPLHHRAHDGRRVRARQHPAGEAPADVPHHRRSRTLFRRHLRQALDPRAPVQARRLRGLPAHGTGERETPIVDRVEHERQDGGRSRLHRQPMARPRHGDDAGVLEGAATRQRGTAAMDATRVLRSELHVAGGIAHDPVLRS